MEQDNNKSLREMRFQDGSSSSSSSDTESNLSNDGNQGYFNHLIQNDNV